MKGAVKVVVAAVAVLAIVLVMVEPGQALECQKAVSLLSPCYQFLTGGASDPSTDCCSGLSTLKSLTPTTADRRAVCDCLKAAASRYSAIKEEQAASLPKRCGVDVGVPISKDTKCSDIN